MNRVRESVFLSDDLALDGSGTTVAILDTGVDEDHFDLSVARAELLCISSTSDDRSGHGTHVAGIIAGSGAASDGLYRGIAPGATLVSLKVKTGTPGRTDDLIAGVARAIELGVDIINYSGGTRGPDWPPWKWPARKSTLELVFDRAVEAGLLCVCAAGNVGPERRSVVRPGIFDSVMTVGAIDDGGAVARASSRGPVVIDASLPVNGVDRFDRVLDVHLPTRAKPDCVAYGWRENTLGAQTGPVSTRSSEADNMPRLDPLNPTDPYGPLSGTSQATAVVTGLAALLKQAGDHIGFDWGPNRGLALKRILLASAHRIASTPAEYQGSGRLIWPSIVATLQDCHESRTRWEYVVLGSQPRLEP